MTNTYGAAWEIKNSPSYPISLKVTSGSQTVSLPLCKTRKAQVYAARCHNGSLCSGQEFLCMHCDSSQHSSCCTLFLPSLSASAAKALIYSMVPQPAIAQSFISPAYILILVSVVLA